MNPNIGQSASSVKDAPVKYRGVPFEYGDMIIIIAPLPLDDVQDFSESIAPTAEEIAAANAPVDGSLVPRVIAPEERERSKKRFAIMGEAIFKSIQRNHPSFNQEDLKAFLTMQNVNPAFDAAMGYSSTKFRVRSAGELPDGWATS